MKTRIPFVLAALLLSGVAAAAAAEDAPTALPPAAAAPVSAPAAPAQVAAEPAHPSFDRAALLAALVNDLSAHYALTDALELDLLRPWENPLPKDAKGAGGDVTVSVVDYPVTPSSAMLVQVRYSQGTVILREDTLALRAQIWRDTLATKVPVVRGSALSLDSLITRRADILRERDALPASVIGQDLMFTQTFTANRSLTWRDVARRAMVRRGDVIEVAAIDGPLQITLKALAMQDGALGDTVRVRNVESSHDFTAKVVADSRAQISF